MGYGDQLMATGMARGARSRGKRIAFGDGKRILWDKRSGLIFRGNPNLAPPGDERRHEIEWVHYYKGNRLYNQHDPSGRRWVWNMDFRPTPGEVWFDAAERLGGRRHGSGFVLIEPNIEAWKTCAPNKDWGRARYQKVSDQLKADGFEVCQFGYSGAGAPLRGVRPLETKNFRDALAILSQASLYVGPEGGLHHGAAAVKTPAVVLFGGFIPPQVTGYAEHANLTGGAEACGSLTKCSHCQAAMRKISVEEVLAAARERLA